MRLEDELKTKGFSNENQKAQINIMFTAGWIRGAILSSLKSYGITPEQYNVLRILRGSQPDAVCLKDITCRMVDRNSNTSRIVDKLAAKNWVLREPSASDRREVQIALTPAGADLLSNIDKQYGSDRMMNPSGLTDSEAETLNTLLEKMRQE
jgi:DNA-binding MarR family transcriptional regulator